jgi:FixJ family two-component response regulator
VPETTVIAVIDDDESFRTALAESLSTFGYEVEEYASAVAFISRNGRRLCNLIVTDVQMPGMSGLDLARRLAASVSKAPVILITARSDAGLEATAADAGATCLLEKPFAIGDLVECIEAALEVWMPKSDEPLTSQPREQESMRAATASLGTLVAAIAHEINQPLASIITNGETSLRWLARPDPNFDKVQELTRRAVADARRAADIIDRIQAIASANRA